MLSPKIVSDLAEFSFTAWCDRLQFNSFRTERMIEYRHGKSDSEARRRGFGRATAEGGCGSTVGPIGSVGQETWGDLQTPARKFSILSAPQECKECAKSRRAHRRNRL